MLKLLSQSIRLNCNCNMKHDEKVYGNLELLVNICVSEKMRTAALISTYRKPAFLAQLCCARVFWRYKRSGKNFICTYEKISKSKIQCKKLSKKFGNYLYFWKNSKSKIGKKF